jgi:hypothetical protein
MFALAKKFRLLGRTHLFVIDLQDHIALIQLLAIISRSCAPLLVTFKAQGKRAVIVLARDKKEKDFLGPVSHHQRPCCQ